MRTPSALGRPFANGAAAAAWSVVDHWLFFRDAGKSEARDHSLVIDRLEAFLAQPIATGRLEARYGWDAQRKPICTRARVSARISSSGRSSELFSRPCS
jgi:hypothetical protein